MSDEIAEEYARFCRPEIYREADQAMRLAFADFPAGHLLRQDVDYLVMLQRQRWIEGLSAFDTGMIKAAGMTVEDLVDFRFARLRQKHAGRTLSTKPDRVLQRQRAYEAIRAADSASLSWGKTIAHVQDASLTKGRQA